MMKRLVVLCLVLLILAGCASEKTTTNEAKKPTNGWYEMDSSIETATGGAIRSYTVQIGTVSQLAMLGNNLLLFEEGDKTTITVMEPDAGEILAQKTLGAETTGLSLIYNAIAYYDVNSNQAVFLDNNLEKINAIQLPDEVEGTPAFAPDSSEIYYCVGKDIKAYDTTLNIVRPIRSHTCQTQVITGVYFGGQVLSCVLDHENGKQSVAYVSTKTGELLSKDGNVLSLVTEQSDYVCIRQDGTVWQCGYGTIDGMPYNMNVPQNSVAVPAIAASGIATYESSDGILRLALYNRESGLKTAGLTVSGVDNITHAVADQSGLWLLSENEGQHLYYWNFSNSSVDEETVYKTPLYTKDNPNKEGLKTCEKRADTIAASYYVDIRIWNEAISTTGGYELSVEHQTLAIDSILDELELVLARYPERFFNKIAATKMRICIVRDIAGELTGLYYRQNSVPYIFLSVGCDVQEEFDKALGYVINSRVLAKSPMLDNWTDINPEGFVYGETTDETYLAGETQAFADAEAMKSVTDDRSRLFYHAMKADNADVFQSEIMQTKLIKLCMGIRDAWRWEDQKVVYPWEQYLKEPLVS